MATKHLVKTARLLDTFYSKNDALSEHLVHNCTIKSEQTAKLKPYRNGRLTKPKREEVMCTSVKT
jgi:hypothetical protein